MIATNSPERDSPPVTCVRHLHKGLAGYLNVEDHRAYLFDAKRCHMLADEIANYAEDRKVRTFSWDVFDTALLREPKCEARRFYETSSVFANKMSQHSGVIRFSAHDAFLARLEAARAAYGMARALNGNREGTLPEIARIACTLLRCPEAIDLYIQTELDVEHKSLTANPLIVAVHARLPDLPHIFVSDMYIEGPHILGLMTSKLSDIPLAMLISSADGLGSKRGGTIFANVEAKTGLKGAEILHMGDSFPSDFQMPRRNDWNSLYLPLPASERNARKACFESLCREFTGHNPAFPKWRVV